MADKSRLMARWSSSYDYIAAQMNGKTECTIYEWIASRINQTYESQIYKNNSEFW